jgi:hypothetical protein
MESKAKEPGIGLKKFMIIHGIIFAIKKEEENGMDISIGGVRYCYNSRVVNGRAVSTFLERF